MKTTTRLPLVVAAMLVAAPLSADQLRIIGGYVDISETTFSGTVALTGDDGFTFQSHVAVASGVFAPGECNLGSCAPGTVVRLNASWSGLDLPGVATLNSTTYPDVGQFNSPSSMLVALSGSLTLPPLGAATTVSAPFVMSGMFTHPGAAEALVATGTATLFLSPSRNPGNWHVDRALYRFASLLPPPWDSRDIGTFGSSGFAGYVDGSFYVGGDGGDIWSTDDAFRFVYQPVIGNADIVAHVAAESATNPFGKAGVMFRESLEASSLQVILDRKPGGELEFMARSAAGQQTTYLGGVSNASWLRLTRSDTRFTGFESVDGRSWIEIGSIDIPAAPFSLLTGLAVTSHDPAAINASVFDNVNVTTAVGYHNLLSDGGFEDDVPPDLEGGWVSDNPLRDVPAKSESNQPRSGRQNGACWTTEFLDCGLYQERLAPVSGAYTLRLFAAADRPGGLVGVNINGETVNLMEVGVRQFGDYAEYVLPFQAKAGDTVRVWMYSPPTPGYVVADDVLLTLDVPVSITDGTWAIGGSGPGQLGRFTLSSSEALTIVGSYDGGIVEALTDCGSTPCVAGQMLALRSFFENQTPLTIESFARGSTSGAGIKYPFLEFGGALALEGATVAIPTPTGTDFPERVAVTAPFTLSGDLKGFEVLGLRDPRLVFDLPLTGHGIATLELLTAPSPSGPVLNFLRLTYQFQR